MMDEPLNVPPGGRSPAPQFQTRCGNAGNASWSLRPDVRSNPSRTRRRAGAYTLRPLVDVPVPQYARAADGAFIAYQVVGDGPVDMAWQFDFGWNLDAWWEWPWIAEWFTGLASFGRL